MLTDIYKQEGVALEEAFGVPYPVFFTHPVAEYKALTETAAVLDLTHWRTLRVTGGDRIAFLNAMLTNDVAILEPLDGCHSTITTIKGKIIACLFVFVRSDAVIVFVPQGDAEEAFAVLQKHIISEDVTIEDVSASFGVIGIEGPKAYDCLWRMFPTGPFPKKDLTAVERKFEDVDLLIAKNSVTGEEGFHLMVPAAEVARVRNYLVQASRGSDGLAAGRIAWDIRRTESGLPWYGIDFTGDNFPHEARLESTVSYSKGCFRGQETLARLKYRGHVQRLLVGLTVDDSAVKEFRSVLSEFDLRHNNFDERKLKAHAKTVAESLDLSGRFPFDCPIYPGDVGGEQKAIGWITTAVLSPRLQKPLMMGYVRHETVEAPARMRLERGGGPVPIDMVELPIPLPNANPR